VRDLKQYFQIYKGERYPSAEGVSEEANNLFDDVTTLGKSSSLSHVNTKTTTEVLLTTERLRNID